MQENAEETRKVNMLNVLLERGLEDGMEAKQKKVTYVISSLKYSILKCEMENEAALHIIKGSVALTLFDN